MSTVFMPIALASAGGAALVNVWLGVRTSAARRTAQVSIGDGGDMALTARMRAHANFTEYTPFALILIALIEYNVGSPLWLSVVATAYLLARIAHALGMDGWLIGRKLGTLVTLAVLLGLGIYAALLPFLGDSRPAPTTIELAPARG